MSDDVIRWIADAARLFDAIVILVRGNHGTQALLLPRRRWMA